MPQIKRVKLVEDAGTTSKGNPYWKITWEDDKFDMVKSWKVTSVPTMILVNEDGEIKRHTGVLKEKEFLKFIAND